MPPTNPDPLQNAETGLHLVHRPVNHPLLGRIARHWAVYDNTERVPVFHHFQSKRGFVIEDADELTSGYRLVATTQDYAGARARAEVIFECHRQGKPWTYNLIERNCEHVARYIVLGKHESRQVKSLLEALRLVVWGAAVGLAFKALFPDDKRP